MRKEFLTIFKEVSKGVVGLTIPPAKSKKPKWCKCRNCGAWHYSAN